MDDDGLVLNLAPIDAVADRPNSRRVQQATKGGRWTDRVKAKRVAKRKDDSSSANKTEKRPAPAPTVDADDDFEIALRPAKRQKVNPSSKQSAGPSTSKGPVISSLFSSNPVIPKPVASAPRPRAGPSNAPLDTSSFGALGLDPLLTQHLANKLSITAPTSIQRAALSAIFNDASATADRDIFIQSQTGSGKTLAYLLPIIQDLLPLSRLSYIDRSIGTLAIIIVPTRELAKQISDVLELLLTLRLRPTDVNADGEGPSATEHTEPTPGGNSGRLTRWLVSGVLTGGATRTHEKARLRKGLPILVATPGRLLDHLQNTESFNVGKCRWLVMDEADRLLELGFEASISGILKGLDGRRRLAKQAASEGIISGTDVGGWEWGERRRTVLCSATIQEGVERLAGEALVDPIVVKGSDVPQTIGDAVPDPSLLVKKPSTTTTDPSSSSADPATAIAQLKPEKFTPPAQLSQKYITVPLKLRLVSLVALLRSIIAQAPTTNRPGRVGGTRIIVFLSCTDSVDFHWNLLGGVQMGTERPPPIVEEVEDEVPEVPSDDDDDMDLDGEGAAPGKSKPKSAKAKTAPRKKLPAPEVVHTSPLLPDTSIYRLHGSLPLPTRMASLKGFTSDPSSSSKSSSSTPTPSSQTPATSSILLCTSVASRGLDLPLVRAVVQYDLPTDNGAAEYVHRVGRTARAGKGGEAWCFVAPSEGGWVPWIEGSMGSGEEEKEKSGGGEEKKGKGSIRLEEVGVQDVLKRGFGGSGAEYEDRATQVQLSFEQWVLSEDPHTTQARKAFQSHMRAYATHPSSEKHIFHVRNLHTGHLAKAFALRETPSAIGPSAPSAKSSSKSNSKARDSNRPAVGAGGVKINGKTLKGPGATFVKPVKSTRVGADGARIIANAVIQKYDANGGLKGRGAAAKRKAGAVSGGEGEYTQQGTGPSAEERMREAVRAQGRLTKVGGKAVSSGASEFQMTGGVALEQLVGRR